MLSRIPHSVEQAFMLSRIPHGVEQAFMHAAQACQRTGFSR
jgi:hypothetical protein